MSTVPIVIVEIPSQWALDERRGPSAMAWFIVSEALLFVMLFFAYFYLLGTMTVEPPRLLWPLVMAAVLLVSSVTVTIAKRRSSTADGHGASAALAATIILGVIFLGLQVSEFRERLTHLTPQSNAYGSIFYLMTSAHGAHVALGLLMLAFCWTTPGRPYSRFRERALHNSAMYWHFVDVVWLLLVGVLYVLPNLH